MALSFHTLPCMCVMYLHVCICVSMCVCVSCSCLAIAIVIFALFPIIYLPSTSRTRRICVFSYFDAIFRQTPNIGLLFFQVHRNARKMFFQLRFSHILLLPFPLRAQAISAFCLGLSTVGFLRLRSYFVRTCNCMSACANSPHRQLHQCFRTHFLCTAVVPEWKFPWKSCHTKCHDGFFPFFIMLNVYNISDFVSWIGLSLPDSM